MIILVTATGTGVGKTWLACALARELAKGSRVVAIKPIETGGGDDGERLAAATGQSAPRHALVRLREPLTPALAAEREGVTLEFDALVADVARIAAGYDHAIVEGAGGLLSPLTFEADATDLARRLDAKVLLVGPDALGTLSATLAAKLALEVDAIACAAIAVVEPATRDDSTGTNAAVLRRRLGDASPRIFEIARGDTSNVAAIARVLASIA